MGEGASSGSDEEGPANGRQEGLRGMAGVAAAMGEHPQESANRERLWGEILERSLSAHNLQRLLSSPEDASEEENLRVHGGAILRSFPPLPPSLPPLRQGASSRGSSTSSSTQARGGGGFHDGTCARHNQMERGGAPLRRGRVRAAGFPEGHGWPRPPPPPPTEEDEVTSSL